MSIIIKDDEQIEGIRKSCKLAAEVLRWITPQVTSGVTTDHLNAQMNEYIRDHKAIPAPLNYLGYPKETCISLNEVICHGIPGERELQDGDILNIDVTTILDGYFGDTSTMYVVGTVPPETQELLDVTKQALQIGIDQVKPTNRFGMIGFEIARYVEPKGYSVVRQFCGHGVGIHFHEQPQILHKARRHDGERMKPGMIFTIEPMINQGKPQAVVDHVDKWTARTIDGKLSAQYEHTVLCTETGVEILTA